MERREDDRRSPEDNQWTTAPTSLWRRFWPDVNSTQSAVNAIHLGAFASLFLAVVSTGLVSISTFQGREKDPLAFAYPAFFAVIAYAVYRRSRSAALAGLLLYIADVGFAWVAHGVTGTSLLFEFLLVTGLVNGVRGTFAYRRHNPPLPNDNPVGFDERAPLPFIAVILAAPILPLAILPALIVVAHLLRLDSADAFIYVAILASLLPGTVLVFILKMKTTLKVTLSILYVLVGFPLLYIYAILSSIVVGCIAFGECL